jgi:phosphatidylglycerophosphatase A
MSPSADIQRPTARTVLTSPVHLLAFGFGSGLAPRAPGTFGTLVGILFWFALCGLSPWAYAGAVLALFILGCWVCGRSAELLGVHDYGGIVFDEVVGYIITTIPMLPGLGLPHPGGWSGVVIAFVLFRLFDILKPWPIRVLDRRVGGGTGIMIDDVVAGLFAAAVMVGLCAIWPELAVP